MHCVRSLNPSPIFLASATVKTSMLLFFFPSLTMKGEIHVVLLKATKNLNLRKNISHYSRYLLLNCSRLLLLILRGNVIVSQEFNSWRKFVVFIRISF